MAKNKEVIPALENTDANQEITAVEVEKQKAQQKETKAQPKNKKAKKEKKQSKLGRKAKETVFELKKVSWPSFKEVVKKTGVVLAVVLFFGLVLFGFDYVLKFMFKLITSSSYTQAELWSTVGILAAIVIAVVVCVTIWIVRKKRKGNK